MESLNDAFRQEDMIEAAIDKALEANDKEFEAEFIKE